ncbi:MAG TPA: rod shape-determining protein MreC, partial [Treponemataceae bacterium]|nr:rod shape-determining protein MreC [Treponemataceae bacterium]
MVRQKTQYTIKSQIIVLVILILSSGTLLALSTGGFILNFRTIGFSAVSTFQKGIHSVSTKIIGSVTAVRDLHELQKEYNKLNEKLKEYEYM